jgi:hypothetical protein
MIVPWLIPTPLPDASAEADIWKFPELSMSMPALFSFVRDEIDMQLSPDPLAVRSLEISPFPIAADSCSEADLSRLKELEDDAVVPPLSALKPTLMQDTGDIKPNKNIVNAKTVIILFIKLTPPT